MTSPVRHILFVCTGNSSRSLMAEAVMTVFGKGKFVGYSAGTRAGGLINPFALDQARKIGYPAERLRNKSYREFFEPHAQTMDFIISVCDQALQDLPESWPGDLLYAHWPIEPPLAVTGTNEARRAVFDRISLQIQANIEALLGLAHDSLDRATVQKKTEEIGQIARR